MLWFFYFFKQSRYPLPAGMSWSNDVETTSIYVYTTLFQRRLTMMAIISTLLFQINIFERYSRSKIKNDRYKLSPSLQTLLLNNKY